MSYYLSGLGAIPYNVLVDAEVKVIANELREGDFGRKRAEVLN